MHSYKQDGTPFHFKDNGQPVTLREVRKEQAVPSVTEILNVVAKPALTQWKVNQGILAALTLPKVPDESDSDYIARILSDSKQQAIDAAEEGSRIHDALEKSIKGESFPLEYGPHVEAAMGELSRLFPDVNDWVAEQSFAHPMGFGGMVDLHSPSTGIIVDYKSKDGDFSDGKRLHYDQNWQLGAYQRGLGLPMNVGANIFLSRTHPGKVGSHVWSKDDMDYGWQVFWDALSLWKKLKRYDAAFEKGEKA